MDKKEDELRTIRWFVVIILGLIISQKYSINESRKNLEEVVRQLEILNNNCAFETLTVDTIIYLDRQM